MDFQTSPHEIQTAGKAWNFIQTGGQMHFEVRGDDSSASVDRSELASYTKMELGHTYQISYSLMVEPGAPNTAGWLLLNQAHPTEDAGEPGQSPPLAVELAGDKMRIVSRFNTQAISSSPTSGVYADHYTDSINIVRGQWYDMVIQVKFDPFGGGLLNVWRDGVQLVHYEGAIGFNDQVGPYWKEGVYREAAPETMAADFKNTSLIEITPTATPTPTPTPAPDPTPTPTSSSSSSSSSTTPTISGAPDLASLTQSPTSTKVAGAFDGGAANDHIETAASGGVVRGMDGDDTVIGGDGADSLNGNAGADVLVGGGGADSILGGRDADSISGGAGDDSLSGNLGSDTIEGGSGADVIFGGKDADSLSGGASDDTLSGDMGDDILAGGTGADKFVFGAGGGHDWVVDFKAAEGDHIVLLKGTAYTVTSYQGQAMIDLGHGDVIGLAGVAANDFKADWVVYA